QLVVALPVALEIVREVEHRLVQHAALAQQEGDQQAPDAAVAVEERVNGLELRVRKADLDQQWQITLRVGKCLEIGERLRDDIRGGRNEGGFVQSATARADPVLSAAQLTGRQSRAADAVEKLLVDFPDQADRHWQLGESRQAVVHGGDVVDHLVHIL